MARTTADRALAHGLLKPELAEDLLGVLANIGTGPANPGTGPQEDQGPDHPEEGDR